MLGGIPGVLLVWFLLRMELLPILANAIYVVLEMVVEAAKKRYMPVQVAPPAPPIMQFTFDNYWLVYMTFVQFALIVFLILKPRRVSRVCEHGFVVEKTVQGSEYHEVEAPDFIGEVWGKTGWSWTRRGTFFRVGPLLYTTAHNVAGCDQVKFRYRGKEQIVEGKPTEYDLDFITYDYLPFSHWQMGSGKFVKYFAPSYVACHNGSLQSYGMLSMSPEVGFVQYSGSTTPGFSGAPYFANRRIYGMHTGWGVLNKGFCGAWMHSVLTSTVVRESTQDDSYLTDPSQILRKAQEKGEMEYRYMGNDYVSVRAEGRYYTLSEDEFERLRTPKARRTARAEYEPECAEHRTSPLPATSRFDYQDEEPVEQESGNASRPAAPVTVPAGRESISPAPVALPRASLQRRQEPSTPSSHPPQPQPPQNSTTGLTAQAALQSALSAITSGRSVPAGVMERLSKNGMKQVRVALRVMSMMRP